MALEDLAKLLHTKLAEELLARLETGEASAAELNVVRQFLKDNNVDDLALPRRPIRRLSEHARFEDPHEQIQLRPAE